MPGRINKLAKRSNRRAAKGAKRAIRRAAKVFGIRVRKRKLKLKGT